MRWFHLLFCTMLFCSFGILNTSIAQNSAYGETQKVKWLTWEEAVERSKTEKRKILLDVYTQWCGWCKKMDTLTFNRAGIAQYINDNFYPVKFDAQQREDVEFEGKTFKYHKNGPRGYHDFAVKLLRGRMSYPTLVFMDEEFEIIQSIVGFKTADQFEVIATYFATDQFMKMPWSSYKEQYIPKLAIKEE